MIFKCFTSAELDSIQNCSTSILWLWSGILLVYNFHAFHRLVNRIEYPKNTQLKIFYISQTICKSVSTLSYLMSIQDMHPFSPEDAASDCVKTVRTSSPPTQHSPPSTYHVKSVNNALNSFKCSFPKQKPSKFHISSKCWQHISNKNIHPPSQVGKSVFASGSLFFESEFS